MTIKYQSNLSDDQVDNALEVMCHEDSYRKYNIPVAKILGNIEYAVLLYDIVDYRIFLNKEHKLVSHPVYGDGFMYYTIQKSYERCGMSRCSFESGIKLFIKLGFIDSVVKFGNPCRKYFRINRRAIFEWMCNNKEVGLSVNKPQSSLQKSASKFAETSKQVCRNLQRNESNNESKKESNIRLSPPVKKAEDRSSFSKNSEIVSFDPFSYRLRDGKLLSSIMAKTLAKKMKDPHEKFKILTNVSWYEKQVNGGLQPKNHESYLQNALTKNLAEKENVLNKNKLYSNFLKEEHQLHGLKILKTVVQLENKDGSKLESISFDLPENTFCEILDSYLNKNKK